MASRFLVYGLIDPRNGELRYVGKSCSGMKRPRQLHHAYCRNWENSLRKISLKPEVVVFEEILEESELSDVERFWVANFKFLGADLTNLTEGGEGSSGCRPGSETRKKMSLSRMGKPSGMKGKTVPEERRKRISESLKSLGIKREFSAEHRAKLALAKIGRPGNNRRKIDGT